MRKRAIVAVSNELLSQIMGFPGGTRIAGARIDPFGADENVELVVEHDDLPDVPEYCEPRRISPQFRAYRSLQEFVSWGIT